MPILKKRFLLAPIMAAAIFALAGCFGGPAPEEELYQSLEKVVEHEEAFRKEQKPLVKLELDEKKTYDKIMKLGMKDFEEISALSKDALKMVDQREEHLKNENESIQKSKKEFKSVSGHIEKIEDPKLKKEALSLKDMMSDRYESYDKLFKAYSEAIDKDRQLYKMLQDKELELKDLEEQIASINESYQKVMKENESFNEITEKFNEAKLSFYKDAGLDVVEKKDK